MGASRPLRRSRGSSASSRPKLLLQLCCEMSHLSKRSPPDTCSLVFCGSKFCRGCLRTCYLCIRALLFCFVHSCSFLLVPDITALMKSLSTASKQCCKSINLLFCANWCTLFGSRGRDVLLFFVEFGRDSRTRFHLGCDESVPLRLHLV
jgi:hypothetical protein